MGFEGFATSLTTDMVTNAASFMGDFRIFLGAIAGLLLFGLAMSTLFRSVK